MPDTVPNTGDLIRPATAQVPRLLPIPRSAAPVAKPAKPSLALAILRGLARRWKPAVVLGAVLAGSIGAAVWFLMPPPQPTATAKLFIPQNLTGSVGPHPDQPLERATQIEWLRSHLILTAALRSPD